MNDWKVEVYYKPEIPDTIGHGILEDIADLGISGVISVRTATVYWIKGTINSDMVERIGRELLADPITQVFTYKSENVNKSHWTVEVQFKPGVTDAVGESTVKGIKDLGISGVDVVHTGQKYWLTGTLDLDILQTIAQRLLMNDVIQTYSYSQPEA